jgi:hypothetical protein
MAKFAEIPKFVRCSYSVHILWKNLKKNLDEYKQTYHLDLNPVFQREYVWTQAQKISYIEFKLRGGAGANEIFFNCPGWDRVPYGEMAIVDGKQRLNAVLEFLDNRVPAFGNYLNDYEDQLRDIDCRFIFSINGLDNLADVYRWYYDLNAGGTKHTKAELDKVLNLIADLSLK